MNRKHVTNLELSKALFEAGITKDYESEFAWAAPVPEYDSKDWGVFHKTGPANTLCFPALLLSELLEIMPEEVHGARPRLLKGPTYYYADYEWDEFNWGDSEGKTPLEALSSLASYLLREGKFNKPTL